ncbi:hypothetical protein TUBRATIS_24230, partial [Tubulinosema ratisbonensis]
MKPLPEKNDIEQFESRRIKRENSEPDFFGKEEVNESGEDLNPEHVDEIGNDLPHNSVNFVPFLEELNDPILEEFLLENFTIPYCRNMIIKYHKAQGHIKSYDNWVFNFIRCNQTKKRYDKFMMKIKKYRPKIKGSPNIASKQSRNGDDLEPITNESDNNDTSLKTIKESGVDVYKYGLPQPKPLDEPREIPTTPTTP